MKREEEEEKDTHKPIDNSLNLNRNSPSVLTLKSGSTKNAAFSSLKSLSLYAFVCSVPMRFGIGGVSQCSGAEVRPPTMGERRSRA